jgi:hypothetical protein
MSTKGRLLDGLRVHTLLAAACSGYVRPIRLLSWFYPDYLELRRNITIAYARRERTKSFQ